MPSLALSDPAPASGVRYLWGGGWGKQEAGGVAILAYVLGAMVNARKYGKHKKAYKNTRESKKRRGSPRKHEETRKNSGKQEKIHTKTHECILIAMITNMDV
jgi:hypothetical protein